MDGFDHVWVAVPNMGDIVIDIQVAHPINIIQPDSLTPDDVQGALVK
jgi:hypothetical protein